MLGGFLIGSCERAVCESERFLICNMMVCHHCRKLLKYLVEVKIDDVRYHFLIICGLLLNVKDTGFVTLATQKGYNFGKVNC
jgi:hypothetical protein